MRNWPLKTPVMGWCLENVTHEVDIETRVKHTSVYVIGQTCGETKRQNYSIDFLVFNNTYNTSVVSRRWILMVEKLRVYPKICRTKKKSTPN
jgi:hypothetical protein